MNVKNTSTRPEPDADRSFTDFQNLMKQRMHNILLVSSQYDSFNLSQDGQIHELIFEEFMELNLYQVPIITQVSRATDALKILRKPDQRIDLVITTVRIGMTHVTDFATKVRKIDPDIPIILLAYENRELEVIRRSATAAVFDRMFLWQGDFRILLAIVKSIEDSLNVEHDNRVMGVQTIILIEDNTKFYSSYLPLIYTELMRHSQNIISEGLNLAHKVMRMRARPKILLFEIYEDAWEYYKKYEYDVITVITDREFVRKGKKDPEAGVRFAKAVRARRPDLPMLIQSFKAETASIAEELGIFFIRKDSPTLLTKFQKFLAEHCGFGDFIFRGKDGKEIRRAEDLKSLEAILQEIPDECLLFHSERDHFSNWLKARTEFELADRLKPRKVGDYPSLDELRDDLVRTLRDFRRRRSQALIVDFRADIFDNATSFARIGGGSLGGKGRGIAFVNRLLHNSGLQARYADISLSIPQSVVLCTDVFDEFMSHNNLLDQAVQLDDYNELRKAFLKSEFPDDIRRKLADLLTHFDFPLAVRSSSLLEDSQYLPFAGIYETLMLPNNAPDDETRLDDLLSAVKLIYASIYSGQARHYIEQTPYRLEEEKMAVIIQRLVGQRYGSRFYPTISGVARSYNFYAKSPMKPSEGIVAAALGLGREVVEGGETVRFSPAHPNHLLSFVTTQDYLDHSQKEFYALDTKIRFSNRMSSAGSNLRRFELKDAEKDGTLYPVGSTYSAENDAIFDGLSRPGTRLITFAPILKHDLFPLADIMTDLLELGERGIGGAVEIEFAANLSTDPASQNAFSLLQIRPMVLNRETEFLVQDDIPAEDIICSSHKVLGFGRIDDIKDIVLVDPARFDRSRSLSVAAEIEYFNHRLSAKNIPYLLIGVGRWGSADPWLGIPVTWEQISGARVIIETGFRKLKVTPSEGSHFSHNLISFNVGYFTVNPESGDGTLDWEWLLSQPVHKSKESVSHLKLDRPMLIIMNGHKNEGLIRKPAAAG